MINLDYSDIALEANYSEIISRNDINTSTNFLKRSFLSPVLPANMACTINCELAANLCEEGYFSILHRFYNYTIILNWIKDNQDLPNLSISVGVNDKDKKLIDDIISNNLNIEFITIDVAHGHHILVKEMANYIKSRINCKLIAGNVMTKKACQDFKKWGIDAAKVGLSRGKACSTYDTTGVGSHMFTNILECSKAGLPIIADGGIRSVGDICKALVAGANMVMVGSLFVACRDSPAETIKPYIGSDREYKVYYGSASEINKGHSNYIEGSNGVWIDPNNMTYLELHNKINQGIRSCMSYGNCKNMKELVNMKYNINEKCNR